MKITVLLENATPSSLFIAKHGLSLLLDAATAGRPGAVPVLRQQR